MKFTISINQRAAVEMGLNLDFSDLAILDYTASMLHSSKCIKVIVDKKEYGWIDPKSLIDNMPLLGISTTKGINIRLEKLINAGMLERCPENVTLRRTYLRMGIRYDEYIGVEDVKSASNLDAKPEKAETTTEKLYPSQKANKTLTLPYNSPAFVDAWEKLIVCNKVWRDKTETALKMSLNKLAQVSEYDAIRAINDSIENGWQGVFPKPSKPVTNASMFRPQPQQTNMRSTTLEELMK